MAELHLYDFDSTLFRSPHQPAIWDGDWWSDPASLMEPCVPDRPNKGWWIPHTVETAKKSISDPNVFAVMMTGRKDNSAFRYRVPELLKQQRLTFDAVHLTPKTAKSAKKYKIEQVLRYLQQYPQIKKVQIWDDRKSHLQFFERVLRHFGYRVKTHFVHDFSREPSCDTMKGVSSPKAPKKPRYVGIFLTGASKSALINAVGGYLHDVPKAEHITLGFKLTPELEGMLGQKVRFQVEGIAEDADGQAVVVNLGHNSDLFKKKGVPHITISHSDRVAPKYSNDLLAKGSRPLHPHILFEGIIDTFPSSFTREVVRGNPSRGMFKVRRNPVRKQGDKWAVIKPDGSVDLLLGDEKAARRLAVACGYDSTPSSSQPVPERRAKKKKTPKNRTPRRGERQKGAASGVQSASLKLRLTGGGVIGDQDGLRPFLVAEVAPNKFRAFYMSTGKNTPGMTPTGTWVHFGGIAAKGLVAEDGRAVGRSFDGWFIKPREKYGSKRAYPAITKQLALQVGDNVPLALSHLRYIFGKDFLEADYDRMGADGVGLRVNAYLAKRGAIDAYAGSEAEEYKRGMGHKYLKEGVAPAHIGARTVYAAPRMRFNSNRGRYRMRSNPAYRGGAISPLIQQMTDIDLCKAWNSTLDLDFDERREGRHFTYENEIEELEREIDYRADGEDMDDWCTSILRASSNPRRPRRRRR